MAILCLSNNFSELKKKLGNIIVAFDINGNPITANDLKATGSLALLLKDAIKPNIVQTLEGTPALIHGGPFANIAHGCNSVIATKYALKLSDIVVTEAGFGADLGAEKFINIKCRLNNLKPDVVVLVATIRALKMHGGLNKNEINNPDSNALKMGLENLNKHIENIKNFNIPLVVTLNHFPNDIDEEIEIVKEFCKDKNVHFALSKVFSEGGNGGIELAKEVESLFNIEDFKINFTYDLKDSIKDKIKFIATKIYGASDINYSNIADKQIKEIEELGYKDLPICIAKTQYSLSDSATKLGCPKGFNITVKEVKLSAGAGFIVVLLGNILTMPGLPKVPSAENIDIDEEGIITGLF